MKYWKRDIVAWRKNLGSLSYADQGMYAAMLDAYYANEEALPADKIAIYKMVGALKKVDQNSVDRVIALFFHDNGGALHNERADLEIKEYRVHCENQRRRRMGIKK